MIRGRVFIPTQYYDRMPERRKRRWRLAVVFGVVLGAIVWFATPYARSAALLMDMTGAAPGLRRWIPIGTYAVETRDLTVPTRNGAITSRLYRPSIDRAPAIVVFPGVHGGGIDEPRLVALSRRIAAAGAAVLAVPIPELRRYELTTKATDSMEDTIRWAAAQRDFAPSGRVGVVAVSFAGGLALVAAGRPGVSELMTAFFALGPHADLPRVIRYLCLDPGAVKDLPPPHDYGAALMLRASLALMVPPEQVAPLDRAITTFLDASSAQSTDGDAASRLMAEARAAEAQLPEPARSLMHGVNERNLAALGPQLAPFSEQIGGAAALSPIRSPATRAPVFLLHGDRDNVIPANEAIALQEYLLASGNTRVDVLLTPLLSHADAKQSASFTDMWRLVTFWTRMWRAFGT